MRTENFKRGLVSILLVFVSVFSMISIAPFASPGDWVNRPEPGGTTIEVAQGGTFLIRHVLEWDEPESGAYTITLSWINYYNFPSMDFTFVSASAYFTTGGYAGWPIQADVEILSSPSGPHTVYALSVRCPADSRDPRNGQFNVDIYMSASGAGGVPHILGDHPIEFTFGGVIVIESGLTAWNRAPITIKVLPRASYKESMPDLGQHSRNWCWVASAANSFKWYAHHGYPELLDDPSDNVLDDNYTQIIPWAGCPSPEDGFLRLLHEIAIDSLYPGMPEENIDPENTFCRPISNDNFFYGLQEFIDEQGAPLYVHEIVDNDYYGGVDIPPEDGVNVIYAPPTFENYKKELGRCQDVLLTLDQRNFGENENENEGLDHIVTGVSFIDEGPGKQWIEVSDPWTPYPGPDHNNLEDRYTYDILPVVNNDPLVVTYTSWVAGVGPVANNVQVVKMIYISPEIIKENMPDLGQHSKSWCWVASAANSIKWFAHHGYPELLDDPLSPGPDNNYLQIIPWAGCPSPENGFLRLLHEIAIDSLYPGMPEEDIGPENTFDRPGINYDTFYGLQEFIDEQGAPLRVHEIVDNNYYGGVDIPPEDGVNVIYAPPTFEDYKRELERCQDVLLTLDFRNTGGWNEIGENLENFIAENLKNIIDENFNIIDENFIDKYEEDVDHRVTGVSFVDGGPGNQWIVISDPWTPIPGPDHNNDENRYTYDYLLVVNEDPLTVVYTGESLGRLVQEQHQVVKLVYISPEIIKENMPDLGQHSVNWCWVASAANSIKWFAHHGYPELLDDPSDNVLDDNYLQILPWGCPSPEGGFLRLLHEIAVDCLYPGMPEESIGWWDTFCRPISNDNYFYGLQEFLDEQGVPLYVHEIVDNDYFSGLNIPPENGNVVVYRPPTFDDYKREIGRCQDVLLQLNFRNSMSIENEEELDHIVTGVSFFDGGSGYRWIEVSDPWTPHPGPDHNNLENRYTYDILPVVNEDPLTVLYTGENLGGPIQVPAQVVKLIYISPKLVENWIEIEWIRQFGSSANDYAYIAAVDTSDDVYVAGHTYGALPGQSYLGSRDAYVRKYDDSGNELWTRQFGTSGSDSADGLSADTSGNLYVGGYAEGALPGQICLGEWDVFVRKYDGSGNELWTREFGTIVGDAGCDVAANASDNVYVVGYTWGTLPDQSSSGLFDAFVRKYDSSGNELWTRQFGTSADDGAYGVAVDAYDNVYVTGRTGGALPDQSSSGGFDAFVRKYDGSGNELWTRQFGTSADDWTNGVAVDASGNVYVSGFTDGALPDQSSSGLRDAFVRKYDSSGNELWTKQFGTSNWDFAGEIAVDAYDNVYVAGSAGGALPGQSSSGENDAFVRKYDGSGNELWTREFGTSADDYGSGVAVDTFSNVYIAGWTWGTLPCQSSSGGSDAFVAKFVQPWTGTAVFGLENLYAVNVNKILDLGQGSKLVVKFYTYGDAFEDESVIEYFSPPWHVSEYEKAQHPDGLGVKKVRLDLTTDDTSNVISTIASFTVTKTLLEIRFTQIPLHWALAPPDQRVALEIEFSQIPLYWALAPS